MWFSCRIATINNKCKSDVNSFFQIVLNSTNNYSSYVYHVHNLIKLNINIYPNDNMRKENALVEIIKYILNINNPRTKADSGNLWNTGCRFFVWLFGYNKDLCD